MNEEIAAELHALNENIRELTCAVRELNNDTHKQYLRESLDRIINLSKMNMERNNVE